MDPLARVGPSGGSAARTLVTVLLASLWGCLPTGQGCAGGAATPYPDPPPAGGARQAGAVRAYAGQGVLDLLRQNLGTLLGSSLPVEAGRAVFYLDEDLLPAQSPLSLRDGCVGPNTPDCATPTPRSSVSVDLTALERGLSVTWADAPAGGPGLRFELTDVDLYLDLVLVTDLSPAGLATGASCRLHGDGAAAPLHLDRLAFTVGLAVVAGATGPQLATAVDPAHTSVALGRALALRVDPCGDPSCTDPLCAADPPTCTAVCGFLSVFFSTAELLTTVVTPVVERLAPVLASGASSALTAWLAGVPLELASQVSLASAPAAAGSPPLVMGLRVTPPLLVTGSAPRAALEVGLDAGVTVALQGGVDSLACGPAGDPPDTSLPPGPGPEHTGSVEVNDPSGVARAEVYDLAVAVSQRVLGQLAWSVHQGGLCCLDLDGASAGALTGGALTLTAGLLESLAPGLSGLASPSTPVLLVVAPQLPPVITVGATSGAHESLLAVRLDALALELYLLVDEGYSRLTRLSFDVDAGLGLEPGPGSSLEVVVDAVHVSNVVEEYDELAPGADLAGIVSVGAELALGSLLAGRPAFSVDLATVAPLGAAVRPRVLAVRGEADASGDRWLDTYLALCGPDDERRPECAPAVAVRPTRVAAPAVAASRAGVVALEVACDPPAAEWQASVDGGPWSAFTPATAGVLEVASPRLRLAGRHELAVRARTPGVPASRGPSATVAVEVMPVDAGEGSAPVVPAGAAGCNASRGGLLAALVAALGALRVRRRFGA